MLTNISLLSCPLTVSFPQFMILSVLSVLYLVLPLLRFSPSAFEKLMIVYDDLVSGIMCPFFQVEGMRIAFQEGQEKLISMLCRQLELACSDAGEKRFILLCKIHMPY